MIKWKKSEHIYEIKILADWKVFSKSTSICSIYNHREINEKVLTAFIVSSPRLRNFPEALGVPCMFRQHWIKDVN